MIFQLCEQSFDTECETLEEEECNTIYEEICEPVYKVCNFAFKLLTILLSTLKFWKKLQLLNYDIFAILKRNVAQRNMKTNVRHNSLMSAKVGMDKLLQPEGIKLDTEGIKRIVSLFLRRFVVKSQCLTVVR